jgi:hypothetical protein
MLMPCLKKTMLMPIVLRMISVVLWSDEGCAGVRTEEVQHVAVEPP